MCQHCKFQRAYKAISTNGEKTDPEIPVFCVRPFPSCEEQLAMAALCMPNTALSCLVTALHLRDFCASHVVVDHSKHDLQDTQMQG